MWRKRNTVYQKLIGSYSKHLMLYVLVGWCLNHIRLSLSFLFQLIPIYYNSNISALDFDEAGSSFVRRIREMWQLLPSLKWSCRTQGAFDYVCFLNVFASSFVWFPAKARLKPWPTFFGPWVPGNTAGSSISCNLCFRTHERENGADWHLGNEFSLV